MENQNIEENTTAISKDQAKLQKKREKYNKYYHEHKDHIRQYRKDSGVAHKSYESYYEKKKEYIRQRNLQRYYEKKAEKEALKKIESLTIEIPPVL